jgi:hypothetical protein
MADRTRPRSTSQIWSASSTSFTRILISPSVMCAMQVAQLRASQDRPAPARRALLEHERHSHQAAG